MAGERGERKARKGMVREEGSGTGGDACTEVPPYIVTSLVPTSLWILAGFSGLAKHKSRYLTKLYSITTNCNYLKYRGICLKEVNIDFFIVIYLIVAYLQKSRFCFSDYLVAKGPVIHRLVGIRLVSNTTPLQYKGPNAARDFNSHNFSYTQPKASI
jgi:hypothetical protein